MLVKNEKLWNEQVVGTVRNYKQNNAMFSQSVIRNVDILKMK